MRRPSAAQYQVSDSLLRAPKPPAMAHFGRHGAAAAWAGGLGGLAWGQPPRQAEKTSPLADPREFTLELPAGPVQPGNNRCVQFAIRRREDVVVRVLAEVGSYLVLILPNGRLTALPAGETTNTDKPFAAATAAANGGRV